MREGGGTGTERGVVSIHAPGATSLSGKLSMKMI
jgi:hypothetical protein